MQIYHFDGVTNEFVGESTARLDPLEQQPMIPANATDVAAPATGADQIAVFNGTTWTTEEDHRGKTVYNTTTKEESKVEAIGAIDAAVTELVPGDFDEWSGSAWVKNNALHWDVLRFERDAKLAACDYTQLPDAALPGASTAGQWVTYRTALRDLPTTYPNPDTVVWPTEPS